MQKSLTVLTPSDRSQLERKDLARGAWAAGQIDNALLILDTVLSENMTPAVAAECYVTQAAFFSSQGRWDKSLTALERAAPNIDSTSRYVQGTFFNQRARTHKERGEIDAALTDYEGAAACFESAGNKSYEGAVAINVAGLCLSIGDLPRATANIERAITIFSSIESEYLSQAYDTQANIQLAEGKLILALKSVERAISLITENEVWLQTFLVTRGKIRARLSDFSARSDFDRAIELAREQDSPTAIVSACCGLIRYLDLPIEDLVSYYQMADVYDGPELKECARTIISLFTPYSTVEQAEVDLIRRALVKHGGSITRAARSVGLTHRGVSGIVDRHPELLPFRKPRRVRRRSIFHSKAYRKNTSQ